MSNGFEDARHHGYSRADMAQEMEELERRMHGLGCDRCHHGDEISPICEVIINHPEKFFSCGFCCEPLEKDHQGIHP